jgi:hypothetical protein
MQDSAQATLIGNRIVGNGGYGIVIVELCYDVEDSFQGHVSGRGNIIPGPDELEGNKDGAICPGEFGFLITEAGGEFDRRE